MVVFGQSGCFRAKVVLFGQSGFIRANMVLIGQVCCILKKVFLFLQK